MITSEKQRNNSIFGTKASGEMGLKAMFSEWGRSLENKFEELSVTLAGERTGGLEGAKGNQGPCRSMCERESYAEGHNQQFQALRGHSQSLMTSCPYHWRIPDSGVTWAYLHVE